MVRIARGQRLEVGDETFLQQVKSILSGRIWEGARRKKKGLRRLRCREGASSRQH